MLKLKKPGPRRSKRINRVLMQFRGQVGHISTPKSYAFRGPPIAQPTPYSPPQKPVSFWGPPGDLMRFRVTMHCIESVKLAKTYVFSPSKKTAEAPAVKRLCFNIGGAAYTLATSTLIPACSSSARVSADMPLSVISKSTCDNSANFTNDALPSLELSASSITSSPADTNASFT